MKKLILITALLALGLVSVIAQDTNADRERIHNIEEYFSLFEVNVEVWYNSISKTLNFEDCFSKDFDDMIFQWGYLMTAFEFMLEDSGQIFEDLDVEEMVYSFFHVLDPKISKYDVPNMRYDIWMKRWWSIKYFQANRRGRQEMLCSLFDEHYTEWFPSKRQF